MAEKGFAVAPPGEQLAVCADLEHLGVKPIRWQGKTKMKPRLALFFLSEYKDEDGRHISIREEFTDSFNEKSNLRKFLDSWRGQRKPDSYYSTFDLEKVIGATAVIEVVHATKGDRTYANIKSIRPVEDGRKLYIPNGFVRRKDRMRQAAPVDDDPEMPF